ncbi:MAG: glycosyltransferase family 2 protein [Thermoproteales archaeon]|nr:glycosyltransferase family 2 protein [Thermoproteales archaeon]
MNVTVGIPVYNEGPNILRLVKSIMMQDIYIDKIIIVDDGSNDITRKLLEYIKKLYPQQVDIIRLPENRGKANALNIIFKHATSKYLVLLDSDVYLHSENTITKLIECAEKYNAQLVCGWYIIKIKNNKSIVQRAYRFSSRLLYEIAKKCNHGITATGAVMLLKKELYSKLLLPPNLIRVDAYIYLATIKGGMRFKSCPNALVTIQLTGNETMKQFIYRQERVKTVPAAHLHLFGELAKKKLNYPPLGITVNSFIKTFVRSPIDGISWAILKLISWVYRKIFKIEVYDIWRKYEK